MLRTVDRVGLALLGIGACLGCAESTESIGVDVATRDSAGVDIVEISGSLASLTEWSLTPESGVVIDGAVEPFLSNVGEVEWLSDGRIVVEDNQARALYLFDAEGRYLRQLGDRGDGPGQFQNMTETSVLPGDSIFVYDRVHDRVSVMHPDLGFVRSFRFSSDFGPRAPLDVFALGADRMIAQVTERDAEGEGALPQKTHEYAVFHLTDGNGTAAGSSASVYGGASIRFERGVTSTPYDPRPVVAAAPDAFVFGAAVDYDLTWVDADFTPFRIVRWSGWVHPIPDVELEELLAQYDADTSLPADLKVSLREALYSTAMLPESRPALNFLAYIDERGGLWLSEFLPIGLQGRPTGWHVLDGTGRPLGRFSIPPGATLAAVRSDRILLVELDDFDVPALRAYRVGPVASPGGLEGD